MKVTVKGFTTPHLKNEVFTLEKQVSHLREEKSSRKEFTFLILEGAVAHKSEGLFTQQT